MLGLNGRKNLRELLVYNLVALASALTDILIFTLFFELTGKPLLAQGVARLSGGALSFFLNKNYSFLANKQPISNSLYKFALLYVFSYLLSLLMLERGSLLFPDYVYSVKITSDILIFFLNFLIMKTFVFKNV